MAWRLMHLGKTRIINVAIIRFPEFNGIILILLDDCGELLGVSDRELDELDGDSILEGIEGEEEIDETTELNQVNLFYIVTKTQYIMNQSFTRTQTRFD